MILPKRLLDTEAVAVHYRCAPGTVRYWASVHGWTKYGTRRHRLWDLDEIEALFEQAREQVLNTTKT